MQVDSSKDIEALVLESRLRSGAPIGLPSEQPNRRATPNAVLRSALFGVVGRGKRERLNRVTLASQDGYEIVYSGEQLDQSDLDVWLAVKHLCADEPLGVNVEIGPYALCQLLDCQDGKRTREWIQRALERITAAVVSVRQPNGSRMQGHIIDSWSWEASTKRFNLRLGREIAPLFMPDAYTMLTMEERQALGRSLSRWLHGYWSSHRSVYPIRDVSLRELCGSTATIRKFRQGLRAALEELIDTGFLQEGAYIDERGVVRAARA